MQSIQGEKHSVLSRDREDLYKRIRQEDAQIAGLASLFGAAIFGSLGVGFLLLRKFGLSRLDRQVSPSSNAPGPGAGRG